MRMPVLIEFIKRPALFGVRDHSVAEKAGKSNQSLEIVNPQYLPTHHPISQDEHVLGHLSWIGMGGGAKAR